jgi:hypothetical protein
MKKILVLYYTQSGQLKNILDSLVKPLQSAGSEVHFERIEPIETYPFPWTAFEFFNAFPETFSQKPYPLKPLSAKAKGDFDLVIVGYQPWFLTPSRPMSSFVQSEEGKKVLENRPVVTVLGCRNMWLGAQEKMKRKLLDAQARLVGNVALVDRSGNLVSLITILRWMFTGNSAPFWFFPKSGVSDEDVRHAAEFGKQINRALQANEFSTLQSELNREGAVEIKPNLVLMEKRGQKAFSVWSKFVAAGGSIRSSGRKLRVYVFMYVLPTAVIILTPLLWLLSTTMLIAKRKQLIQDVEYYKQNLLR